MYKRNRLAYMKFKMPDSTYRQMTNQGIFLMYRINVQKVKMTTTLWCQVSLLLSHARPRLAGTRLIRRWL